MSDSTVQHKAIPSGEVEKRGGYPAGGSGNFALKPMPRNFPQRPVGGTSNAGPKSGQRER